MVFEMQDVDLGGFFRSLANDKRQDILFRVLSDKRPHSVGEIAAQLSIAVSTASEHLSLLRQSGVIRAQKKEREVYYQLDKDRIRQVLSHLTNWLDCC